MITKPRTNAQLIKTLCREAANLDAAAKNARTDAEREHAETGRRLTVDAWKRAW